MADCSGMRPQTIGDRIRYFRKKRGLTQAQFAEKMGDSVKPQTVSDWERDLHEIGSLTLREIAMNLGVTPNDLLLGESENPGVPKGIDPRISILNERDKALINEMIDRCCAAAL